MDLAGARGQHLRVAVVGARTRAGIGSTHLSPRAVALFHPYPSLLVAAITGLIARLAGGRVGRCARLGLAMLALQASIGAVNDVADAADDDAAGRAKPIPAGRVSRRAAAAAGCAAGLLGLGLAARAGRRTVVVAAAGYGVGLAYDLGLKGRGLGPACFAAALPLVPAFATVGTSGQLPPRLGVVVPMAAIAGAGLAIANSLADADLDLAAGPATGAPTLGRTGSLAISAAAEATVAAVAAATGPLRPAAPVGARAALAAGTAIGAAGIVCSAIPARWRPQLGWELQALGVGLIGMGWFRAQRHGG